MTDLHKIALTKIPGIGPKHARNLLAYHGNLQDIFTASLSQLQKTPGIGELLAQSVFHKKYMKEAEEELLFTEKHDIEILWIEDANYPRRLKQCVDAPLTLYYKGNADLNNSYNISIVGTRNMTTYGKRICEDLVESLSDLHPLIISGLAYGVDIYTHKACVKHGVSTVGIMGHGLDRIYPSAHREVASRMLDNGGLLTEFCSGTIPDRVNFPMRNRIIAGLADVTIVVEAARKGGALITAEIANSYNRDVCAFPGGIDQPYSEGCNYLIKTNRAHLIRHADDLLYLMNWQRSTDNESSKQLSLLPPELSKDEHKIYQLLNEKDQATVDEIAHYCDWPQSKLAMILLEMEMNNIVISLPGKVYRLVQ